MLFGVFILSPKSHSDFRDLYGDMIPIHRATVIKKKKQKLIDKSRVNDHMTIIFFVGGYF